jgi:hypothetical protein
VELGDGGGIKHVVGERRHRRYNVSMTRWRSDPDEIDELKLESGHDDLHQ